MWTTLVVDGCGAAAEAAVEAMHHSKSLRASFGREQAVQVPGQEVTIPLITGRDHFSS